MKLNHTLGFLFFLFSTFLYSQQKVSVVDADTKKPIPQVRVEYNQEIFYTNDDGNVELPIDAKKINIFSPEYLEKNDVLVQKTIEMSLKYKTVDAVVIRPVDAKKIIESVLSNYDKNYETNTSIYRGTYKTKSKIDNQINRLLIMEMDVWSLHNSYVYGKKNTNDFLQINLRNKKYDRNKKSDKSYIFNNKKNTETNTVNAFLERLFLYNQLYVIDFTTKDFKINGNIIDETGDIETIKFKSDNINYKGLIYFDGVFQYNKKENVINYFKVNQHQENAISKYINYFDQEITVNADVFTVAYEMYKKDGKYLPSKVVINFDAKLELEKKIYSGFISHEFVFSSQQFGNRKGLPKKIDLSKGLEENITDNVLKDNNALLSTEEQSFVDEK